jgi:hypothetical protein
MVCGQWSISIFDINLTFFSSLKKQDSGVQVELGDDVNYPIVVVVGSISFQLE